MESIIVNEQYQKLLHVVTLNERKQKSLRRAVADILCDKKLTLGQRVVIAYLTSTFDLAKSRRESYEFKQSELAEKLGMSNKGVREILEVLSEWLWVQKHPSKYGWWEYNEFFLSDWED